jgi:hypothetical protein
MPIKITQPGAIFSSELWLFGDITPDPSSWQLNYRGEFRTTESNDGTQFEDLIIDGKANLNPKKLSLSSTMDLVIERRPVGTGSLNIDTNSFAFHTELSAIPVGFLAMVGNKSLNPYWRSPEGTAEGVIGFTKTHDQKASLKGKIHFDGSINLSSSFEKAGKWQMNFEDSRWETSFISPQGEISYFRRAQYDFDKGEVTQFAQELGFTGVQIDAAANVLVSLGDLISDQPDTFYTSSLSFKNCSWGERSLEGSFRYGITPQHRFYTGELKSEQGKLKLDYQMKGKSEALDVEMKEFSWLPGIGFMQPYFNAAAALMDGNLQGRWQTGEWLDGKWLLKIKGKDLQELQGHLNSITGRIVDFAGLPPFTPQRAEWDLSLQNQSLKINKLLVSGETEAQISGQLGTGETQKSWLLLLSPGSKSKPVRKEVEHIYWKDIL